MSDHQSTFVAARPPRWRLLDVALLVVVIGIALAIRLTHIDDAPSFDEVWHIATTKGIGNVLYYYPRDTVVHDTIHFTTLAEHARPVWAIWTDGMQGILHPPLFIITLRVWREIAGEGNFAAHLFSITFSLIGIAFCFATARLAFDRWIAAVAGLALACSQTQVYLAQEIRPYGMLAALGGVAVWMMTRGELYGYTKRRAIVLALLTLPIVLTHYFGLGGALAMAVHCLIRGDARARKWFVGTAAIGAIFFLFAWVPFAVRQIDHLGTGDSFLTNDAGLKHQLLLTAGTPFRLFADRNYIQDVTPVASGVLFVLPWFLLRRFRVLLPWALWLCMTIGLLVVLDLSRWTVHVALARYLAFATPAVPLLFAGVVWPFRRWLAYTLLIGVWSVGLIYLISKNAILIDSEDLSPAARILEQRVQPGDAIATYQGRLPEYFTDMLLLTVADSHILVPRTTVRLTKPMTPAMVQQLGTRTLWLVSGDIDMPIDELVPGGRETFFKSADRIIRVRRIEIDPAASPTTAATTSPTP